MERKGDAWSFILPSFRNTNGSACRNGFQSLSNAVQSVFRAGFSLSYLSVFQKTDKAGDRRRPMRRSIIFSRWMEPNGKSNRLLSPLCYSSIPVRLLPA